jgi:VWFA-related protein
MRSSVAVILLAAAAVGTAAETQNPAPPRFPGGVETVIVDVAITDKKGNPITDLSKSDFTILEDGATEKIDSFDKVELPLHASSTPAPIPVVSSNTSAEVQKGRSFIVVFDDLHMTSTDAKPARETIARFLTNGTREGDRVMLLTTGGGAWWNSRMESGREELLDMLKHFEGRRKRKATQDVMGDWEAMRIHMDHDTQVADNVLRRWQNMGVDMADDNGPQFTMGENQARGAIDNGPGMINAYIAMRAQEFYTEARNLNTATLDTLERALLALQGSRGRKSMVLVSSGFISDYNLPQFRRVLQAARRANVAIYFVDVRGLSGIPALFSAETAQAADSRDVSPAFFEQRAEAEGSDGLAEDTGGFSIKNTNDLNGGIDRIANESRSYYLIGYNPVNAERDGKWRKIQVKVNRKGVEIHARKGYFAPGGDDKKPSTARTQEDKIHEEFRQVLDSPNDVDGIPLRMSSYVLGETILGKANTVVVADVDVSRFDFEQKDGKLVDTAEVVLVVSQRETGEFWDRSETVDMGFASAAKPHSNEGVWYSLTRDFDLPPGRYQAKLVIRHKKSGRVGSVSHDFTVPKLDGWRVSSVLLTDGLQARPGSDKANQPRFIARRTFQPQGMLLAKFDVFGSAKDQTTHVPKVAAGYVVKDKSGNVVTQAEPTVINPTPQGGLSRLMGFRTEGWAPGDYELTLTVRDDIALKSTEVHEPFSIVAGPATAAVATDSGAAPAAPEATTKENAGTPATN